MSEFYSDDGSGDPFWEELGKDEVEAEASPEPEAVADDRPRNPDGTFAPMVADEPAEAVEEPDDVPEAVAEDVPDDPDADAAALKAQIEALEKRLADKDEFNGRLSNELGELRRLQEQIAEQQSRPQVSDWDSLIDDNPARAAQLALQAGNNLAYQQARSAWEDLSPGAPDMFEQNLRLQKQMQELAEQVKATTAPIAEQQRTQQVAQAYALIKEQYPDYDKFEDAMAQAVEARPLLKESLKTVLASGDTEQQFAALEDLYLITAGRATDTLHAEKQKVNQSLAEQSIQARQDAIVVSATSNQAEPPAPKTWWDVAEADEQRRADGWNIS